MNNQSASIGVTDQIPVITREVIDDNGVARTEYGVEFVEAGVTLQVKPMIGEDGILSVSITPSIREQTGTVVTPDGLIEVPIISQRQATTLVRVSNGQAIALGGLRSTRKDETRQGIPYLMNVPWLGQLFSSTVQSRSEVELMILLTPRVIDDTCGAVSSGTRSTSTVIAPRTGRVGRCRGGRWRLGSPRCGCPRTCRRRCRRIVGSR